MASQDYQKSEMVKDNQKEEILMNLVDAIKNPPYNISYVILKSLFLNVFSEFDAFIGDLLNVTFSKKWELLKASQKQVTVDTVFCYDTLEEFKDYIIRDEVDKIKRESYVEQFNIFENLFDMKLREFENWSSFVEITQRRNIIMHCDGIITDQYIKICKKNKCKINEIKLGDKLIIDFEYLTMTLNIIEEVAIKLLHVIWRKQFRNELESADNALNDYLYELLVAKNWTLAINIGRFAIEQNKTFNYENKLIFAINYCIALREVGDTHKMQNIFEDIDFSGVKDEYLLAKEVLLRNYDKVYRLMRKIGNKSDIFKEKYYLKFPLFSQIQEEEKFSKVFNEIFQPKLSEEVIDEFSQEE